MDTTKSFLVAGGDLRQVYLAEKLATKDNIVYAIGFDENISFSDGICQLENTIMLLIGGLYCIAVACIN